VKEDTAIVFSGQSRIDLVNDINSGLIMLSGKSERNEQIHGLSTLRNRNETTISRWKISLTDFASNQCLNAFEAPELTHENFCISTSMVRSSARCNN